jgi:hypothetical protein
MDYGNILSRAWKITWNNKVLWIFGFLTGLGSGAGSANSNFRSGSGQPFQAGPGGPRLPPELERQLQRPEVVAIIITVVCVLLLIGLALFVLSVIGRGGLIGGIRLVDDRMDTGGKITFSEAWRVGIRYFWRLLGLTLLLVVPAILFGLLVAALVLLTLGFAALCVLPLLCVFIILMIPLSIVVALAQFGVVLEDKGVIDSLRRGWEVLKTNLANIILLGLITVVIGFVIGFVLALPLIAIVIPAAFAFAFNPREPNMPVLLGAGLAFLCYLPILWVINSVLTTWIYSVWTLAYRQFTGNLPVSVPPSPPPAPDTMQPA